MTLEYCPTDIFHGFCHSSLLRRQLVSTIVRLRNCRWRHILTYLRAVKLTGSAKGPPDQRDSMFSCVISCEVPPGVIAEETSEQGAQGFQEQFVPPRYPFPTGSHSLDQICPGFVYHRPFPEEGNPGGAEAARFTSCNTARKPRPNHILRDWKKYGGNKREGKKSQRSSNS